MKSTRHNRPNVRFGLTVNPAVLRAFKRACRRLCHTNYSPIIEGLLVCFIRSNTYDRLNIIQAGRLFENPAEREQRYDEITQQILTSRTGVWPDSANNHSHRTLQLRTPGGERGSWCCAIRDRGSREPSLTTSTPRSRLRATSRLVSLGQLYDWTATDDGDRKDDGATDDSTEARML